MACAAATVRVYQRLLLYNLQSQGTSSLVVRFVVKEQALKARGTDWSERAEHASSPGLTQLREGALQVLVEPQRGEQEDNRCLWPEMPGGKQALREWEGVRSLLPEDGASETKSHIRRLCARTDSGPTEIGRYFQARYCF